MPLTPVIAIFDVGKTNKKLFLFDESYRMLYEESVQLPQTEDEENFPCEDVQALTQWIRQAFRRVAALPDLNVKAVNFSAYGASFIHIDEKGAILTPLYNYLKPYPNTLQEQFYNTYGGKALLSQQTATPVLGSLSSGLQLYRIKYEQPTIFKKIQYSLHLPQYLSSILSQKAVTDITSVGCHTLLWDFEKGDYHQWVQKEGLLQKFAPLYQGDKAIPSFNENKGLITGIGLHDSSAALIPYLTSFHEPFVLISTGTWCISLNPFNDTPLTPEELQQDCLCYLTYEGKLVKASRLFAGNEHEEQVKRLVAHFSLAPDYYKSIPYRADIIHHLLGRDIEQRIKEEKRKLRAGAKASAFGCWELKEFSSYEEAYHQLILDIIIQQVASTGLVVKNSPVKRIFVDGGFSKNAIYMNLLAAAFPKMEVYAASMAQATAIGAALAIHASWNTKPLPNDIIELKYYGIAQDV